MRPGTMLALAVWAIVIKGPYYIGAILWWNYLVFPTWRWCGRMFRITARQVPDSWKQQMIRFGYNPHRPRKDD